MIREKKCIKIDLDQFKLHLYCKPEIELTLHFNTTSRKFYLSVIALVINEMKKQNNFKSILLQNHLGELTLLNKTVGKEAGSSKKELLLPRIYRKWKDALPKLDKAPLFQIVGRKKRYDDTMDKVYVFSEKEKDHWANLFEYMGSHENVRLKFAIDNLSMGLDDIEIVYSNSRDSSDAWKSFIKYLKQKRGGQSNYDSSKGLISLPKPMTEYKNEKMFIPKKRKRLLQIIVIVLISALTVFLFRQKNISVSEVGVASIDKMAFPLPDKPSIAVLPFDNVDGTRNNEFIADDLTEQIILTFSKIPSVFVISKESSFFYKNSIVKVKTISEELGVRYLLEGSIQTSGDQLLVGAKLIDAVKGEHLWVAKYDRQLKDVFEIKNDLISKVFKSVKLNPLVNKLMGSKPDKKNRAQYWENYYKVSLGWSYLVLGNKESNEIAKRYFEEAIENEPDYISPYIGSAYAYHNDVFYLPNGSKYDSGSLDKAFELCERSISLDEDYDLPHRLLATLYLTKGELNKALSEYERAMDLNPNSHDNFRMLGRILIIDDKPEDAIKVLKKMKRLNPKKSNHDSIVLGVAHMDLDNYEEALIEFNYVLTNSPKHIICHQYISLTYALAGRYKEARKAWDEVLKIDPTRSVTDIFPNLRYSPKYIRSKIEAFHKAGIK